MFDDFEIFWDILVCVCMCVCVCVCDVNDCVWLFPVCSFHPVPDFMFIPTVRKDKVVLLRDEATSPLLYKTPLFFVHKGWKLR